MAPEELAMGPLPASHNPRVAEIQEVVSRHFGLDPSDMRSSRRARAIAQPRQVAMWLSRQLTPRSLPEIGQLFGNRDHSTVIHAIRRVPLMIRDGEATETDLSAILRTLASVVADRMYAFAEDDAG